MHIRPNWRNSLGVVIGGSFSNLNKILNWRQMILEEMSVAYYKARKVHDASVFEIRILAMSPSRAPVLAKF